MISVPISIFIPILPRFLLRKGSMPKHNLAYIPSLNPTQSIHPSVPNQTLFRIVNALPMLKRGDVECL